MLISKDDHTKRRITTKEFHKRLGMCAKKLEEAKKCRQKRLGYGQS